MTLTRLAQVASRTVLALVVGLLIAAPASADLGFLSAGTAFLGPEGEPMRQAGGHPDFETQMVLDRSMNPQRGVLEPTGTLKDVRVDLPPGLVGSPQDIEACTADQLRPPQYGAPPVCPLGSQVGILNIVHAANGSFAHPDVQSGLYNMVTEAGEPAKFGFVYFGAPVTIVARIRPTDYGISAFSMRASQATALFGIDITLWGVPGAHSHDSQRIGLDPTDPSDLTAVAASPEHPIALQRAPRPFLSLPTSCSSSEQAPLITANSWEHPDEFVSSSGSVDGTPFRFSGCDQLDFKPSVSVRALSRVADEPTGLDVDMQIPQNDNPNGLASAHVRRVAIRFPEGMSVSPSAAAGLGACSPAQIGIGSNDAPSCPDSSKIGSVEVKTPLLADPLEGEVILAQQNSNPFGSLLALYLAIKGPGFYVKLPGRVDLDPATGQLTGTFDEAPQLPFNELHVQFYGGAQAALATPPTCGAYTTHSEVTSWASDVPVSLDSPMVIDEGCGPRGFAPGFSAGVSSPVAGSSSPLSVAFSREDREQDLQGIDVSLPPGLVGNVSSVPLCPEAQAAAGTCSAASQVGHVDVLTGPGSEPLQIPEAGRAPTAVYLAGPYKGAPFSLSVVVPAQAGPFDLGTVVVRAALFIDPNDAHVTVKSDPLPSLIQGIPLRIRRVNVVVDRPGFIVTPTNCTATQVSGVIRSDEGASASVSSHFQVGDCASLAFKPRLTASTQAKTSRANGASLSVGITAQRGEANIHGVSLQLPVVLPSRLTTLQKACTEAVFAANPAGCPAASFIGSAKAATPILGHPLTGPAILVSHGGEAFPDVVFVLQGEGVTVQLVGNTSIRKGVTTSTFRSIPDAPVSAFQASFPEGPHSVLAANLPDGSKGSLCSSGSKLVMPTTIIGQNGVQVKQTTKLAITGCPKAKAKKKPTSKHKAKPRAKKRG